MKEFGPPSGAHHAPPPRPPLDPPVETIRDSKLSTMTMCDSVDITLSTAKFHLSLCRIHFRWKILMKEIIICLGAGKLWAKGLTTPSGSGIVILEYIVTLGNQSPNVMQ